MNGSEIERALRSDRITGEKFVGVFASDSLPKDKEYPGAYIVNTDPSSKPGQHWIAFFLPEPGRIEVFDSFGKDPVTYSTDFAKWIGKDHVQNSRKTLQSNSTTVCGNFCLFFILLRCYDVTFKDIASILTSNTALNDKFVHKFINKFFNIKT